MAVPWVLEWLFWLLGVSLFLVLVPLVFLYLLDRRSFRPFKPSAKPSRTLGNRRYAASAVPAMVDTVIIGSGQGGLSCGAVLSQFGETVVVCEQHEVTGGGAHTFAANGKTKWRFDAGLHITIPPHEQALQLACGAAAPPVAFDMLHDAAGASDYIALGGGAAAGEEPLPVVAGPLSGGPLHLETALAARFPSMAGALRRYFSLADAVQLRFGLLIGAAILPGWLRCAFLRSPPMALWRRWAAKTAAEGLLETIPGDSEEARRLRSYMVGLWLDTGAPPSRGSFFMQTAVLGGWQKLGEAYPRGGPQRTALALVEAIEGRGGAVFVRCPVAAVVMGGGGGGGGGGGVAAACGVRLANGDVIRARRVVSAIGYRATEVLLAASAPAPARAPAPLATQQSAGFVMANIGLNGTARELGIDDATLWLQPADASNGFDALRGERAFFADPLGVPESQIPAGITFPSVKGRDGHVGEAGAPQATCVHHSCQILVPAEWVWFAAHAPVGGELPAGGSRHAPPHLAREGQAAYDALKLRWSARLLSLLHAHFPRTKGRVEFCDLSTPLTLEHYLRAVGGAGVGLDVTPQRFVDPAEMAELDARHPRVPGLWRAGQDYLMCGQVMAAASGIITALRMRGVADTARFAVRAVRLLLASRKAPAAGGGQSAKEHKSQ